MAAAENNGFGADTVAATKCSAALLFCFKVVAIWPVELAVHFVKLLDSRVQLCDRCARLGVMGGKGLLLMLLVLMLLVLMLLLLLLSLVVLALLLEVEFAHLLLMQLGFMILLLGLFTLTFAKAFLEIKSNRMDDLL